MCLAHVLLAGACLPERSVVAVGCLPKPKQQNVDGAALDKWRVESCRVVSEETARFLKSFTGVICSLSHLFRAFQLLHSLAGALLVTEKFVSSLTLLICQV